MITAITEPIIISLVNLCGTIIAGWFAYRASKSSQKNSEHIEAVKESVVKVEKHTNGMQAALIRQSKKEGVVKGRKEVEEEQRIEDA